MIVGRARNAKLINATWKPTSEIKDEKRKSPPASEKLITGEGLLYFRERYNLFVFYFSKLN